MRLSSFHLVLLQLTLSSLAEQETFLSQLALVNASISLRAQQLSTLPTNSNLATISHALDVLPQVLPEIGLGLEGMLLIPAE